METPLISIVIPVYNVEKYLRRCIESVIIQKYSNLEIILVNDGSKDNSGAICESYVERDSRIKVIHKENGGLSDARNVGINVANGELISFIDADDFIDKDFVGYLYGLLVNSGADIAFCGYLTGKRSDFPRKKRHKDTVIVMNSQKMLLEWHGKYTKYETIAWNKLYKRDLFVKNNIYYPIGYYHEDVQTTHLLVASSKKIVMGKKNLYYYYQRGDSITGDISEKRICDNMYSQQIRLEYFQKSEYKEAALRMQISRQKRSMYYYYVSTKYRKSESKQGLLKIFLDNYEGLMSQKIGIKNRCIFWGFKNLYKFFDIIF